MIATADELRRVLEILTPYRGDRLSAAAVALALRLAREVQS